ncbi:hypothetical protein CMEL01_05723 [Colletotrichum melonis]|uniref:Uncharacterized protein n=1 Tax=Colletotrichum melonis TaxID=1209925 RepID=A0AAI9XME6_9PEZI|nr:hypothetical protein CMEL01_05723 [Colletotrichum melonis]
MTQPAGRPPYHLVYLESQTPSSFSYYAVRTHLSYGAHTHTGTPCAHTKKDGNSTYHPWPATPGTPAACAGCADTSHQHPILHPCKQPALAAFWYEVHTHTHTHTHTCQTVHGLNYLLAHFAPLGDLLLYVRILELRFDFILQDRSSITHVFSRYCNPLGLLGP